MLTTVSDVRTAWQSLPSDAQEPIICANFLPSFLEALGFNPTNEVFHNFTTDNEQNKVSFAARKNTPTDIFIQSKRNPYLILEAKGKEVNLAEGSPTYKTTVKQLKNHLLSSNCQKVRWGLICNANQVQLFKKHGKVIHPASPCLEITAENLQSIIQSLKAKIWDYSSALTVAIYNNKGGVGKTTTVINLAGVLALLDQKVVIIDFDPQQRDLTNNLDIQSTFPSLLDVLKDKQQSILQTLAPLACTFKYKGGIHKRVKFDVIPPSNNQITITQAESDLRQYCNFKQLYKVLEPLRDCYDYILIDAPPNINFFSESAVYASDVILIPTQHNNVSSLKNAAGVITQFIPRLQQKKRDGTPVALPIFFNGEKITDAQEKRVNEMLFELIKKAKETQNFDLLPYFCGENDSIFHLNSHAVIAEAAFKTKPAVYLHKTAYEYYRELAKEYFIQ